MERTIALIGTNHLFQLGGNTRIAIQNSNFKSFLRKTCEQYEPRLLAEEMSEDALNQNDLKRSTVATLALELGIPHAYCDPPLAEQRVMGLCVERNADLLQLLHGWSKVNIEKGILREHKTREQYWLDRIIEKNSWPVVFVCGAQHVKSFGKLLHNNGLSVDLIAANWDGEVEAMSG